MKRFVGFAIALVCVLSSCSKEEVSVTAPYFPKVKTIISNHCLSCHASTGSWQGRPTAFDTDEEISNSYASIKAAVNDPSTPTNKRMPQTGSLSANEIQIIIKWWELGGKITD
jgi:uncharacterized membrane protein